MQKLESIEENWICRSGNATIVSVANRFKRNLPKSVRTKPSYDQTWDNPNCDISHSNPNPDSKPCLKGHDVLQMHIPPRCVDPTYHNRDLVGLQTYMSKTHQVHLCISVWGEMDEVMVLLVIGPPPFLFFCSQDFIPTAQQMGLFSSSLYCLFCSVIDKTRPVFFNSITPR